MPGKKKETNPKSDELNAETADLNDICGTEMNIVTDGQLLEDGIVELTDKKEHIDEP